jgi:hypothetical protein
MRRLRFVVLLEWAQGLSSLGLVVAGAVHLAQVGFRDSVTYLVMFAGLALGFWSLLGRRSRIIEERAQGVASPPPPKDESSNRTDRLLDTRNLLPEEPPPGWSRPRAPRGARYWVVDAGSETLRVELHRQGPSTAAKVLIFQHGTTEPVSDARCAEILEHVQHVTEFFETDGYPDWPGARAWVGFTRRMRPRWPVPASVPAPRERELSPHLVAARKYLPQKLPAGWSVPIAIGDDHGTGWKDGAWMIGTTDDWFMIVFLVTSRGRVKLSVTFFGGDGHEVSEGSAAEMLRHFRGVLEFAQTEVTEGSPDMVPMRTYLGEIAPEGKARVLLN